MRRVIRKFTAAKEPIYSPLDPQSGTIRVLVLAPGYKGQPLKGNLVNIILETGPDQRGTGHEYDALSYYWGDDPADRSILIGKTRLKITPNLYDALQHLRSETASERIWIDQICINQEDTIERNRQVQQMDAIYAGAREVIAWLGTATKESRVILGSLCQVKDRSFNGIIDERWAYFHPEWAYIPPESHARGPLWTSICAEMRAAVIRHHPNLGAADDWCDKLVWDFHALLRNPWFQRTWIIQECVLASQLYFQAGNDRISWQKLFSFLRPSEFEGQLSLHQGAWIVNIRQLRAAIGGMRLYPITLGLLVSMFRDQNSRDPRDKVYGLLGLAARMSQHIREGAPNLKVDYSKSVVQVFIDVVAHDIESCQDIRIPSQCCSGRVHPLQGLPSWAEDWTRGPLQQSCEALMFAYGNLGGSYKACGTHNADGQVIVANYALSITGLDFDIVDETTKEPCMVYHTKGPELGQQQGNGERDYISSVSQEWKLLALNLTSMDQYGTLGARINALCRSCRTFILDRINALCRTVILDKPDKPVSSDVVKAFVSVWDGAEVDFSDVVRSEGKSRETKCRNFDDWCKEFGSVPKSWRRLFRTRRGYLGLSCYHVEKGDKVCILWGGELPFILRESGTLDIPEVTEQEGNISTRNVVSHKIVGGYCYIYGLAGGEGVEIAEKEGLAPQKIYIV